MVGYIRNNEDGLGRCLGNTPRRRLYGTPGRRISFAPDLIASIEEEAHPETLAELCNRDWKIYTCSPLFRVPSGEERLSEVASLIEIQLSEVSSWKYKVELKRVEGLRGRREDSSALKLSLYYRFKSKVQSKPAIVAFFLGIDSSDIILETKVSDSLPLLLISFHTIKSELLLTDLTRGIQTSFDCVLRKASFNSQDLRWMFAIWSGIASQDPVQNSFLAFRFPTMEDTYDLQISLPNGGLRDLWKKIHPTSESEFTVKEVDAFFEALYGHFEGVYGIKFMSLSLNMFSLSVLSFQRDGTINIHDKKHLKTILRYLTEFCQETILPYNTRLGVQLDTLSL